MDDPVRHLYFFDDLSFHVGRILDDPAHARAVRARIHEHVVNAMRCLDGGRQDFVLFHWDHAVSSLAYRLQERGARFDATVSQGCNGSYALESLAAAGCRERMGVPANVRIAHFLCDRADAFHSAFELRSSSERSLEEQFDAIVASFPAPPRTLAVFDDCIQTGEGTRRVLMELRERLPRTALHAAGLIVCEATCRRLRGEGVEVHVGVLLRGDHYPHAWDWDIYFLKDLFLANAVRFVDGSSAAYVEGGWFDRIFAGDPDRAAVEFRAIRAICDEAGVLAPLVRL